MKYIVIFFLLTTPAFATINQEQEDRAEQSPVCFIESDE